MLFGCVYHFFARNMQSLPLPYCLNLCNMIDCSANTPGMFYLNFGRGTKTICKENHSNSYGGNKKQLGIAHNKRHEFAKQENRHADQHAPPVAPFGAFALSFYIVEIRFYFGFHALAFQKFLDTRPM